MQSVRQIKSTRTTELYKLRAKQANISSVRSVYRYLNSIRYRDFSDTHSRRFIYLFVYQNKLFVTQLKIHRYKNLKDIYGN